MASTLGFVITVLLAEASFALVVISINPFRLTGPLVLALEHKKSVDQVLFCSAITEFTPSLVFLVGGDF